MSSNVETLENVATEQSATVSAPETATATKWNLDQAHTSAEFSVRHMMIANVRGEFREVAGTLELDRANIERSKVEVEIKTASVQTNDASRDAHLRSADFFDVEQYPAMTFRSTKWQQKSDDEILVSGELSIHGVTKAVTFKVEGPTDELVDPWGMKRIGFSAKTKINRKDFGLSWNVALEAGGILVGEDVSLAIEAQFVKA